MPTFQPQDIDRKRRVRFDSAAGTTSPVPIMTVDGRVVLGGTLEHAGPLLPAVTVEGLTTLYQKTFDERGVQIGPAVALTAPSPAPSNPGATDIEVGVEIAALEARLSATYPARLTGGTAPVAASVPSLNAKDYGAVGDNVADDTASIQAALNAAATFGLSVRLPNGTYKVTASLSVPAAVTLVGEGWGAVLQGAAPLAAPVVILAGLSDVTLQDVKVVQVGTGSLIGVSTFTGSDAAVAVRHTVRRVMITNTTNNAVRVSSATRDYRMEDCVVEQCPSGFSANPPAAAPQSAGMRIARNTIRGATALGIQVFGVTNYRFKDVFVLDNQVLDSTGAGAIPIEVGRTERAVVMGNIVTGGTRGISTGNNTDMIVSGNTITGQTLYGLETQNSLRATFSGNVVSNCAVLLEETGAATGAGSSDLAVVGNVYRNSGLTAALTKQTIRIPKGSRVTIADNIISGHAFIQVAIQVGTSAVDFVTDACVRDNIVIVDSADVPVRAVVLAGVVDATVSGNTVKISRDLVAADNALRVIGVVQGACSGAVITDNSIVFNGAIAAAPLTVGVSTADAAAGTLPRSRFERNSVVAGPVGYRVDVTSADMIFRDNDGRTCTTEVSAVNAAVLFRRSRREVESVGAPTTGTWLRGDIAWELNPVAAGPPGFVCVTGGTPGTWKAMAALAA